MRIRRLGGPSAVCRRPLEDTDDLQRLFRDRRLELEQAMLRAGFPGDPDLLFEAVSQGRVTERELDTGTTIEWMAFRRKNGAVVAVPVRWTGKRPFAAYVVEYRAAGVEYTFIVPKKCSNLALLRSRRIPTISLEVQPTSACVCQPLSVSATGHGGEGELVCDVTVTSPGGGETELTAPCSEGAGWRKSYEVPGTYTLRATARAKNGAVSDVATASVELRACPPVARLEVTPRRVLAGEHVLINASGSRAEVTSVGSVRIEASRDGASERLELQPPFRQQMRLQHPGKYTFSAVAADQCKQRSSPATAQVCVRPRLTVMADLFGGYGRRSYDGETHSAGFAGLRAGAGYLVLPSLELAATVGGAFNASHGSRSVLFIDLEADFVQPWWFAGLGGGAWDLTHGDTVTGSIFVHGGARVAHWDCGLPIYAYVEWRMLADALDDMGDNFLFLGGLRFTVR